MSDPLQSSLTHDVVLVIDDVHEVAPSTASLRFLESLCRQAPPTLHLVLATRHPLALRIDRLRGQGNVLEIEPSELRFTPDEIEELLPPSASQTRDLAGLVYEATEGWPAAVRLAIQALQSASTAAERESALEGLRRRGGPLFSYLAHEVFERESPGVKDLIRTVAPLERFGVDLCEALGLEGAADAVDELVSRGLFLREQGDSLVLHSLVREFALVEWPLAPDELRSVHARAAAWYESHGDLRAALSSLAAAALHAEIADLLSERGASLLASGGAETILNVAAIVPAELRSARVEQLVGEALVAGAHFDSAIEAFERAAALATRVEADLGWRLVMAHHMQSDAAGAIASYERASPDDEGPETALLLGWVAGSYWAKGDTDEAARLAGRSLELARSFDDDRALAAAEIAVALVAINEGRYRDVDSHLETALASARRCGDIQLLARARVNRASSLTQRGRYGAALDELEHVTRLGDIPGVTPTERALSNRGSIHLLMGSLDEARADYATIVETSRSTGSREFVHGLVGLGDVHCERGNSAQARTMYERALALVEQRPDFQATVPALQGLARVLVDEAPVKALRLARQAAQKPGFLAAAAANTLGWVALALGRRDEASQAAVEAGRQARERDDPGGLAASLALEVFSSIEPQKRGPLLREALVIWRELGSRVRIAECELALARISDGAEAEADAARAERKLRALGVRLSPSGPAGLLRTIAIPDAVPLSIQALGGFRVLRKGAPVSTSEWPTKKSRELLKILVCGRGKATPRPVLMELLWPSGDPARVGNRLSVALSTLRSVLDPEKQFEAEHFVRGDRESVELDYATVLVDAEVFLHEANTGLSLRAEGRSDEATEWLQEAESSYLGDLLEDDPYSEWMVPLREEARAAYLGVTHALAEDAFAAGDADTAVRYFLRVLGRDAYDEQAHLGVVSALERSGRRGESRRLYRLYVARMEQIGAVPAAFPARPETQVKGT